MSPFVFFFFLSALTIFNPSLSVYFNFFLFPAFFFNNIYIYIYIYIFIYIYIYILRTNFTLLLIIIAFQLSQMRKGKTFNSWFIIIYLFSFFLQNVWYHVHVSELALRLFFIDHCQAMFILFGTNSDSDTRPPWKCVHYKRTENGASFHWSLLSHVYPVCKQSQIRRPFKNITFMPPLVFVHSFLVSLCETHQLELLPHLLSTFLPWKGASPCSSWIKSWVRWSWMTLLFKAKFIGFSMRKIYTWCPQESNDVM